jgi:2-keto-3-deoxy-L-rhamnonate aldolase RhmA
MTIFEPGETRFSLPSGRGATVGDLRAKLDQGGVAVGHMVTEFWTRGITKVLEVAGFDFVLFDMEHSGASMSDLADQLAWTKATSLTSIVRIPAGMNAYVSRALDAGADGIMVPQVDNVEDVRAAVRAAKYPPLGRRGMTHLGAHDDYGQRSTTEVLANANRETILIVQIETANALADVDALVREPGVDIAWPGPVDLGVALAQESGKRDEVVDEAIIRVVEACRSAGRVVGLQVHDAPEAVAFIRRGVRCVSLNKDVGIYLAACLQAVNATRKESGAQ